MVISNFYIFKNGVLRLQKYRWKYCLSCCYQLWFGKDNILLFFVNDFFYKYVDSLYITLIFDDNYFLLGNQRLISYFLCHIFNEKSIFMKVDSFTVQKITFSFSFDYFHSIVIISISIFSKMSLIKYILSATCTHLTIIKVFHGFDASFLFSFWQKVITFS